MQVNGWTLYNIRFHVGRREFIWQRFAPNRSHLIEFFNRVANKEYPCQEVTILEITETN